jgi:glutathionylspermidine synthase
MIRHRLSPRADWQAKVEEHGLVFHTIEGKTYWDESAAYELSAAQVDTLEAAANEVHARCVDAAQHIIDKKLWARLAIPATAVPEILSSWDHDDPSLYGRFDFAWDGKGPPKMLEYNADTPTALLEASVIQWQWLKDFRPAADQFNSIHERLITAWQEVASDTIHFACVGESAEDSMTTHYLRDTCEQAGKQSVFLDMSEIGWNPQARRFIDPQHRFVEKLFKLYPWEWMWSEQFAEHLPGQGHRFIEPIWKMLWSNKALLTVLYELFPQHPNLLPAADSPEKLGPSYVRKPKLSREGANIELLQDGQVIASSGGDYGEEGFIYQQAYPMPNMDGSYPVFGVWMIGGEASGLGIREDSGPITTNLSRFVPHFMG